MEACSTYVLLLVPSFSMNSAPTVGCGLLIHWRDRNNIQKEEEDGDWIAYIPRQVARERREFSAYFPETDHTWLLTNIEQSNQYSSQLDVQLRITDGALWYDPSTINCLTKITFYIHTRDFAHACTHCRTHRVWNPWVLVPASWNVTIIDTTFVF